jgi:hypothetical protein
MDIHTAAKYLEIGYRIRRRAWVMATYVYEVQGDLWAHSPNSSSCTYTLDVHDLLGTDWEIITEGIVKDFPITYSD